MTNAVTNPQDTPAERVRNIAQYLYPDLLILVFIIVGASFSIYNAKREEVVAPVARGPGGKPLPITKRKKDHPKQERRQFSPAAKLFFQWASIFTTLTFLATGIAIAVHALVYRSSDGEHGWWCGEPKTVQLSLPYSPHMTDVSGENRLTNNFAGLRSRLSVGLGVFHHHSL